jgi:hypothetical protein
MIDWVDKMAGSNFIVIAAVLKYRCVGEYVK